MECALKGVRIPCGGKLISNLCMDHEVLFDIWGCECDGYQVYDSEGREEGRRQFLAWLKGLTDEDLDRLGIMV